MEILQHLAAGGDPEIVGFVGRRPAHHAQRHFGFIHRAIHQSFPGEDDEHDLIGRRVHLAHGEKGHQDALVRLAGKAQLLRNHAHNLKLMAVHLDPLANRVVALKQGLIHVFADHHHRLMAPVLLVGEKPAAHHHLVFARGIALLGPGEGDLVQVSAVVFHVVRPPPRPEDVRRQ